MKESVLYILHELDNILVQETAMKEGHSKVLMNCLTCIQAVTENLQKIHFPLIYNLFCTPLKHNVVNVVRDM